MPFAFLGVGCLSALSADAAGQLNVLGHDGHALGMDGAQVGVLKQTHQVCLSSLLQSSNGRGLKAQISLKVLSNLTNQTLEGQLAQQQLSALLVAADLAKSHCSWAEAVRLLHSSCSCASLAGSLGGNGLAGSLSSGRLSCGLLGASHFKLLKKKRKKRI